MQYTKAEHKYVKQHSCYPKEKYDVHISSRLAMKIQSNEVD